MTNLEPLLVRQLKKAGHADPNTLPSPEVWKKFLKRISDHYQHMREDREMLTRSLDLTTAEMTGSWDSNDERSHLSELIRSVAEVLSALTNASQVDASGEIDIDSATRMLEGAEATFLDTLQRVDASRSWSTPEIDALRHHLSTLAGVLRQSLGERAQHRSVVRELAAAGSVQRRLLPEQSEFVRPFLSLAGYAMAAGECSGDWWTVNDLPDGRVLVVIGDVTGHGIAAGMLTGAARASCEVARTLFGENLTASSLLKTMNCGIETAGQQELLMTCLAAIFDPHTRSLTLANAGHVLPYLVRQEGAHSKVVQLRAHGTPLGATKKATYTGVKVNLQQGDVLLLYTDGLIEREGPTHEQFGHKRLAGLLEQGYAFDPAGIRDVVLHNLSRHAEDRPTDDDITFVAIRYGETR